jgi:hypothetical protein
MFDTIEEIDAELEKIRIRKQDAQEMIETDSWGGLLRGSTKKAAVMQRERELLEKREKLLTMGNHVNYGVRVDAVLSALAYLEEALEKNYPEQLESCDKIKKELEKIRNSVEF